MQIETRFWSGINPTQEVTAPAEIPVPLENSAGRVTLEGDNPRLDLAIDEAMRRMGVTRIDEASYVTQINGQDALKVTTNRGRGGLALATRPELGALIANRDAIRAAVQEARNRYWAREIDRVDGPLLAEMRRREEELVAAIPADHVRVTVTRAGDADGVPLYRYEVEGLEIRWDTPGLVRHGVAEAVRPGAMGAFATEVVASLPRGAVAPLLEAHEHARSEEAAASAARRRELAETAVPAGAVAAYEQYRGNAEAAWEAEDETGWALIERWRPFIEAQDLAPEAMTRAALRDVREALRQGPHDE